MAVTLNSSVAVDHQIRGVVNPKDGLKDTALEKRSVELPQSKVSDVFNDPIVNHDAATIELLDADRDKKNQSGQDSPDSKTAKALTAYRDIANADKRSEIQSLVGVDLHV